MKLSFARGRVMKKTRKALNFLFFSSSVPLQLLECCIIHVLVHGIRRGGGRRGGGGGSVREREGLLHTHSLRPNSEAVKILASPGAGQGGPGQGGGGQPRQRGWE